MAESVQTLRNNLKNMPSRTRRERLKNTVIEKKIQQIEKNEETIKSLKRIIWAQRISRWTLIVSSVTALVKISAIDALGWYYSTVDNQLVYYTQLLIYCLTIFGFLVHLRNMDLIVNQPKFKTICYTFAMNLSLLYMGCEIFESWKTESDDLKWDDMSWDDTLSMAGYATGSFLATRYLFRFIIERTKSEDSDGNIPMAKTKWNDEPPSHWLWHSCLYGHKRQIRKIIETNADDIDINQTNFKGNAPIHLAIWSSHADTVRLLISRFSADLDWSHRNDHGHNPLDLALMRRNEIIIKLVLRHVEPEMSSLMHAISNRQHGHVSNFLKKLKKSIVEKDRFLPVCVQRFIEISKELDSKKISKERKKVCERNLTIIANTCCERILVLFYPDSSKSVLDMRQKPIETEATIDCNDNSTTTNSDSDPVESKEEAPIKDGIDEIFEEFSCPICCFLMQPPERRIYGCSNDHWICSICISDTKIKTCPSCREDFGVLVPKIRTTSERCLALLLDKFQYDADDE